MHDRALGQILIECGNNQRDEAFATGEAIEQAGSATAAEAAEAVSPGVPLHCILAGDESERCARDPADRNERGPVGSAAKLAVAIHQGRQLSLEFVSDMPA